MDSQARITHEGEIARACLAAGQRGKVLAVFSKAIYLLTDANELFWIATDDSPMHRRCAATPTLLPGLYAGSPFQVDGHHLIIDSLSAFDLSAASLWTAPRVDPGDVSRVNELPARVQSFFSSMDLSQAAGFGSFIPLLLSLSQDRSSHPSLETADRILRFARPLVVDVARACLDHRPSQVSKNADALIGLGAGLTPSGDDFLGGLSFALKSLQTAYPDSDFTDYAISIEPYASKTHLISFTLLKDHASGHAIESLHRIVNGLLRGEPQESMVPFISQLTQLGHSTGWDLLTGLLTGFLVTYRSTGGR